MKRGPANLYPGSTVTTSAFKPNVVRFKCKRYAAALGSTAFGSNVANESRRGHSRLSNVFEMFMFSTLKMFVLPEINTENRIQVNMNNFLPGASCYVFFLKLKILSSFIDSTLSSEQCREQTA